MAAATIFYIKLFHFKLYISLNKFWNVNRHRIKDHVTRIEYVNQKTREQYFVVNLWHGSSQSKERTNESRLLSSDRKTTVKSTIARGPTMDR